jgi:integrase
MTRKKPGAGHIRTRTLKDGSVRYDVLVRENGKQVAIKGGLVDHSEAEAYLAAWHVQQRSVGLPVPDDTGIVTVRQLGKLYLAGITERTRDTDEPRWRARVETAEFIDWPVTQLSERAVRRWLDTMARTPIATGKSAGKPPSRGTLSAALGVLRAALRYAVIQEFVDINVAERVTIKGSTLAAPKGTAAGDGYEYLHEDEVRRILEAEKLPQRQRTAFVLLAFTGARPKDLYRLTWDRVDVQGATVRYRSHKRDRDYTVHLLPPALEVLRAWWIRSGRPGKGYVFVGPNGKPHAKGYDWGWADTIGQRKWKYRLRSGELRTSTAKGKTTTPGWRAKIGIRRPLALYSLRHTCASHLLLGTQLFTGGKEWSLEQVASQLGHADMSTVRRYAVSLGLASKRAVEESREAIKKARL